MATAISPPALLSLEEYIHTSYHPDYDFVDGHLEERNVGERDHNRTQIPWVDGFSPMKKLGTSLFSPSNARA